MNRTGNITIAFNLRLGDEFLLIGGFEDVILKVADINKVDSQVQVKTEMGMLIIFEFETRIILLQPEKIKA